MNEKGERTQADVAAIHNALDRFLKAFVPIDEFDGPSIPVPSPEAAP